MATADAALRPHDRNARKRPFAGWMKRLASLKPSSSETPGKKNSAAKKAAAKNNPYPESATVTTHAADHVSVSVSTPGTPPSPGSFASVEESAAGQRQALAKSNKSTAPTVATVPETLNSTRSKAETGTSNFATGGSTFSSPHGSEQSLSTTLTTIQSTAPSNVLNGAHHNATAAHGTPIAFTHQFPTAASPPSAIPPHLAPVAQQPNSYQGATANNILTDNASILTLASSSKRRRRNSVDTNASMRALAPSSHYGGSRESLPLSLLSANPDSIYSPTTRPPNNVSSLANAERASIYSASGVTAPILPSERNSYYANKPTDGLSVRSGLLGHGRTDSISSIRATPTSPLASPRDQLVPGRISRRSFEWGQAREASDEEDTTAMAGRVEPEEKDKDQAKV